MNGSKVGMFKERTALAFRLRQGFGATSALCASIAVTGAVAHAADYMWMSSPADALWNTTSLNWNSSEAWVDGNNAIFGSSSQTAVNIDGVAQATLDFGKPCVQYRGKNGLPGDHARPLPPSVSARRKATWKGR